MKIGIFTDAYEPYVSGVTTSIKMLKEALESMHHEIYIVTANLQNHQFIYDEKNKIIYVPGIKTGIYETRLTSIYSRKAMKIIKSWHLDVIHSQTEFGIGMFSRLVSKKLNIPIVHTYHTLYEDYVHYVTHNHFNNLGKKIVIKLTKYFCEKTCSELIVPTPKIKDLFQHKYHITKEINVIPTGIDTTKFELDDNMARTLKKLRQKYHLKKNDFVIGTVGRIAKEKNLDKEILAFNKLILYNPNFKLMIVGDGPELANLQALTTKLNLSDHVIFTGKITYDLIPTYYHLFNVMTSFSLSETQGLTIIEGLASSIPIICINDESFKTMIEHQYNGFLFNNDNEFVEYILNLQHDLTLYSNIALNAKNSVYRYSKEVFASEILKVYHKAIQKQK